MYKTDILSVSVHILQLNACCLLNVSSIGGFNEKFCFVIFLPKKPFYNTLISIYHIPIKVYSKSYQILPKFYYGKI